MILKKILNGKMRIERKEHTTAKWIKKRIKNRGNKLLRTHQFYPK